MSDFLILATIAPLVVLAPYVSNLIKMPVAVLEILFGVLGAYVGLFAPNHSFDLMAEVGFLFLMFLCGMEVDLYMLKQLNKVLLKRILIYFGVLYTLSSAITLGFKLPALYIIILPIVSLGMIMTLVRDYGKEVPWLDLVLKVGVFGELTSIILLVIVDGIYLHGLSLELSKTLGILLAFMVAISALVQIFKILFWWFPRLKLFIMPPNNQANQDIRFTIMMFFGLVVIVGWLKLELVLGAFLAGTIVSTFFPHKHELFNKLNDVGFGFFVPLFFVHVGSTLNLKIIIANPTLISHACAIMCAMLVLHMSASFTLFRDYFNPKNTALFALSASMPLTFLITAASVGLSVGAIDQNTYYSLVMAAIFEGILFTSAIKFFNRSKVAKMSA
ncbi:cation:proton antiporter [Helicobacter felis]|uniref:Na+/H+ Antiporter n=1 Tax=Helicobacter felis (strain ATCC 49179 / CCUG 28539 / NCTC 12436 / CS1) TaxID=936155 RepID=E7ACI0_HELFC|nr:cation:proton antiporter [Helicobacter felis]CBY82209.1 Na+/H+ Antiporter [Helicobacter felis ATCC 49179]